MQIRHFLWILSLFRAEIQLKIVHIIGPVQAAGIAIFGERGAAFSDGNSLPVNLEELRPGRAAEKDCCIPSPQDCVLPEDDQ